MEKYTDILKEDNNTQVALNLDNLTDIQRRRLEEFGNGKSRSQIAHGEKVSPQAVSNSFWEIVKKLAKRP